MLAMVRGLSREILSIISWVVAAVAAFLFYKPVLPYVQPYIDNPKIAMGASAAIVFVVALIVVTVITMKIADWIIDSRVGALDRTLGFLYGAARGILVVAVGLMFFNWLVGDKAPAWITEAKSRPLLEQIGGYIESVLPEDPENAILKKLNPDQPATPAPDAATPPATGDDQALPDDEDDGAPADGNQAQPPADGPDDSAPADAPPATNN
jgi:membrane protein required for colicin V production